MGKQLADEDIVSEEGDGLWENGVIMVDGGGGDPVIEDRVSQDIDEEDLLLGNGEAEEVNGDFIGGGAEDGGHSEMEGACFMEHLISSTSQCYLSCFLTASVCPSNPGQSSVVPRR